MSVSRWGRVLVGMAGVARVLGHGVDVLYGAGRDGVRDAHGLGGHGHGQGRADAHAATERRPPVAAAAHQRRGPSVEVRVGHGLRRPVRPVRHDELAIDVDRGRHPLLLLPPVAEPHSHHLLLQLQLVGQLRDLGGGRLGALDEVRLQRPFHRHLDRRPLLPLPALRRDLVDGSGGAGGGVGLLQPLLQQRLQFAHVLEAQLQGLEAADGGLREDVAVQGTQRQPHVGLREAQLDPPLLELLGEGLQVVGAGRVLVGRRLGVQVGLGLPEGVVGRHDPVHVHVVAVPRVLQLRVAAVLQHGVVLGGHGRVPVLLRRGQLLGGAVVQRARVVTPAVAPAAAAAARAAVALLLHARQVLRGRGLEILHCHVPAPHLAPAAVVGQPVVGVVGAQVAVLGDRVLRGQVLHAVLLHVAGADQVAVVEVLLPAAGQLHAVVVPAHVLARAGQWRPHAAKVQARAGGSHRWLPRCPPHLITCTAWGVRGGCLPHCCQPLRGGCRRSLELAPSIGRKTSRDSGLRSADRSWVGGRVGGCCVSQPLKRWVWVWVCEDVTKMWF